MNRSLRASAYAILAAFLVLVGAVVWIQAIKGPEYRDDPRNPRLVAWRTGRERGPIVTADDVLVAVSTTSADDPTLYERSYPATDLYAHVVGYTSVLFGSTGIEETRETELVSDRDSTLSGVLNGLLGGDLRPRGLRLTIDHDLQVAAAAALGDQKGAIVAIDPRTGAILASVSFPRFDPNTLVGPDAGQTGSDLEEDLDQPLRDRVIDESYAPGSTFKVVTAAAGLDSGAVSPSTEFNDPLELELPGSTSTIQNYNDDVCVDGRTVTLEVAFIRSCNTTFAQLGMDVGGLVLASTAEQVGFNQQIPYETSVLTSAFPDGETLQLDPPATAQNAIGQRDVQTTPLLMALTAAGVAEGGVIMAPFVVADVFTSDGTVEESTQPSEWRRAMSPATAAVLEDMMEQVVISGTGQRAAVPGVRVAGKTGTAQVTGGPPHAWFIGYGPVDAGADDAQIALAVVVESGGSFGESASGGVVAAPIAQLVFSEFFGTGTQ